MNIEVKKVNGKWTVNSKLIHDLNPTEAILLDNLIIEARLQSIDIKGEKEFKDLPDWELLLNDKNGN